jgi:hypothetical protein
MKRAVIVLALIVVCAGVFAFAGDKSEGSQDTPFTIGVQAKVSTLGIGGDVAMPVSRRTNLRFGVNAFSYDRTFNNNGITYKGTLGLKSVQTQLDFFPFGGAFHLSPGLMLYNGNKLTADASAPAGRSFDLGDTTYVVPANSNVTGTGKLELSKVGPMFTFGFGNLVPRKRSRHMTASFEAGIVYQGAPNIKLNLAGTVCDSNGSNCRSILSDSTVQANILQQQKKLNDDASPFRFYPIISFGVGYKF